MKLQICKHELLKDFIKHVSSRNKFKVTARNNISILKITAGETSCEERLLGVPSEEALKAQKLFSCLVNVI